MRIRGWRRLTIFGLVVFAAVVAAWASRPWTDTVPLRTPPGVPTQSVAFECGPVFGRATVGRSESALRTPYPRSAEPCAQRRARRNLAVSETVLAASAVLVLGAGARRARPAGAPVSPQG